MNAIEILRAASRSVPNEDYVQFMAAVDAVEELLAVAQHSATALRLSGVEANAHSENPIEWLLHQTEAAIAKAKGESDGR